MVTIIFESHATTLDNEHHLASGRYDVALSELGIRQAGQLGERYKGVHLDAIFCSDLKRSYETAELAFKNKNIPFIKDPRLSECNYGDFTRYPSREVKKMRIKKISNPFLNGESYEQAIARVRDFLIDLARDYDGKKVLIIGHRATQYGLEHWINMVPLKQIVTAKWEWQPGWIYNLQRI